MTAVVGVPSMFVAWSLLPDLGESMSTVRVAVCGAAPLDAGDRRALRRRRPVASGLRGVRADRDRAGAHHHAGQPGRRRPARSVGRCPGSRSGWSRADGDDVSIPPTADADDFDEDASGSPGTDPGEIVVRGANLFSGYWPDGRDGPDADGWWATGDVAYADADGDLFLVDRLRELILVNGFNVYPRRGRAGAGRAPGGRRGGGGRACRHPYTGQTVKAYVVRARHRSTVDELLATASGTWPGSSARPRSSSSTSCRTRRPARCARPSCGVPMPRGSPSSPAPAATCATRPRWRSTGSPGGPARRGPSSTSTGDIELEREYGDRLPVILLDGKEHGYWRVERTVGPRSRPRVGSAPCQ